MRVGAGRGGGAAGGAAADQQQQAVAAGVGRRQAGPTVGSVRPGGQGLRAVEVDSPSPGPSPAGSLLNLALPRAGGLRAADHVSTPIWLTSYG